MAGWMGLSDKVCGRNKEMNDVNPFLQNFPHTTNIKQPRQIQIDCLEWLWQNFANSRKFGFCCPVGVGKTGIGMAILNYAKSLGMHGLYTSPLNLLVDQVDKEFSVMTLKGRKFYPCLSGRDSCKSGFCQDDKCAKGLEIRKCEYDKLCQTCGCPKCVYRIVFKAFQNSQIGNTNFTMFLIGIDNSPEVLIIDEADDIESFTRMHYSLVLEGHISTDWNKAVEELKLRADYLRVMLEEKDEKL